MSKGPSHKRPRDESSEHATKLQDDIVPAEKLDYKKELKAVDVPVKEKLYVLYISNPEEAHKMIKKFRLKIGGMRDRIVSVDVEYTREDKPNQSAVVLQLWLEEQVLVYHITAATKMPEWLDPFPKEKKYTFAGFSIEMDKRMLENSGLEINPNNFIDMHRKWRYPYTRKEYDSLTDVAGVVVHPFYKDMKKKIDRNEDHKLWVIASLPENLIEYATVDTYATSESWKKISMIKKGLIKQQYEKEYGNPYNYYG